MRFYKWFALSLIIIVQIIAGCGGGGGGAAVVLPPIDITAPTVNLFTMPTTATSSAVAVTGLTASDNIGVIGYLITESSTAPVASAIGWAASAPTSFIFSSFGTKTAYAWAKDAAGNVSASRSATVSMHISSSISTVISSSTASSTISFSGISIPIVCGIDLRVTYPSGSMYIDGVVSEVAPVGTVVAAVKANIGLSEAALSIIYPSTNADKDPGFDSRVIATLNYTSVPSGSVSTNFMVTVLKVFDCNGVQIQ
jgi:hypothetical protein